MYPFDEESRGHGAPPLHADNGSGDDNSKTEADWTIIPRIVCADHPDRELCGGLALNGHPKEVKVDPRKLGEKLPGFTHEELEVVAMVEEVYKHYSAQIKSRLINLTGTYIDRVKPDLSAGRVLSTIFDLSRSYTLRKLSNKAKDDYYSSLAKKRRNKTTQTLARDKQTGRYG